MEATKYKIDIEENHQEVYIRVWRGAGKPMSTIYINKDNKPLSEIRRAVRNAIENYDGILSINYQNKLIFNDDDTMEVA